MKVLNIFFLAIGLLIFNAGIKAETLPAAKPIDIVGGFNSEVQPVNVVEDGLNI